MTLDIPDGALASGIVAITGVVVWAIRLVANSHVEALKSQSQVAAAIPPMLENILRLVQENSNTSRDICLQLARSRRAIRRINISALVCEDCHAWLGEPDECPPGMEMCRCSGPNGAGGADDTGERQAVNLSINPPVGRRSLTSRPSNPDSGRDRR